MVFQNKELGSFFNEKFVNFRITPSDEGWQKIRGLFEIRGTPTVVLLKPDGQELDRINGFAGADEFVAAVKGYLAGENLLSTFLAQVEKEPDDIDANFNLGKKYSSRWEDDKAFPFYVKTLELDPEDTRGLKTEASLRVAVHKISSREDPDPEPLKMFIAGNTNPEFMMASYSALARYFQRMEENDKVMPVWEELLAKRPDDPAVMNEYAYNVFSMEDVSRYEKAKVQAEMALASGDEDALYFGHYNTIRYYRLIKDNDTALIKYAEAAEQMPTEAFFAYGYAAVALEQKKTELYDRAIESITKAIEINKGVAVYWDTLAGLHHEKGDLAEAIKAQEEALFLQPTSQIYKQKLDKYRAEEKK